MDRKAEWLVVAVIATCSAACGSSSNEPAGSSAAAVDSCNKVCDKEAEKMCPNPFMLTVEQCKQLCAAVAAASPACQAQLKAKSDCELAADNICMTPESCQGDGGTCM